MTNFYVASWEAAGGKTALCAGIGRHLQSKNKRVGYFKPITIATTDVSPGIDKDTQFIHQTLRLKEPVEALSPFCFTGKALKAELAKEDFPRKLLQAYGVAVKNKDVVLTEGWGDLSTNEELLQASCRVAEILEAKVIILVPYSTDLPGQRITSSLGKFVPHLLGIVINQVPRNRVESTHNKIDSLFGRDGIKVIGILPEDRQLLGVSVAELAERLQADVLCCPEATAELVANVMIGVLSADSGADYFARKTNKAVITRGERPDIQLAALATPTRCLILDGGKAPIPQVLHWAEDKNTPILLAKQDVPSIIAGVEEAFAQTKFRQAKKLEKWEPMLGKRFDFASLES